MLSVPNLTSIDLAVLSTSDRGRIVSEFALLNENLALAKSLVCLSLQSVIPSHRYSLYSDAKRYEELSTISAQFQGPDWLTTPLRECRIQALTLGGRSNFDDRPQHFGPWILGMDWSSLRYLDIENSHHETVLTSLQGRVPRLDTLKLGSPKYIYSERPFPCAEDPLDRFLSSIPKLRHCSVLTERCSAWSPFLDMIYDRIGYGLHSFTAGQGPRLEGRDNIHWNIGNIEELLQRAPALRELALQLDTSEYATRTETGHDCSIVVCHNAPLRHDPADSAKLGSLPELCSRHGNLQRLHLALTMQYRCTSEACLVEVMKGPRSCLNGRRVRELLEPFFTLSSTRTDLEYVELNVASFNDSSLHWRVEARRKYNIAGKLSDFSLSIEFHPSYRWRHETGRFERFERQYV